MYPGRPDSKALAHLHDQARREAHRLQRASVDDFWRCVHAVWQGSVAAVQRQLQPGATLLRARLLGLSHRSLPSTSKKA